MRHARIPVALSRGRGLALTLGQLHLHGAWPRPQSFSLIHALGHLEKDSAHDGKGVYRSGSPWGKMGFNSSGAKAKGWPGERLVAVADEKAGREDGNHSTIGCELRDICPPPTREQGTVCGRTRVPCLPRSLWEGLMCSLSNFRELKCQVCPKQLGLVGRNGPLVAMTVWRKLCQLDGNRPQLSKRGWLLCQLPDLDLEQCCAPFPGLGRSWTGWVGGSDYTDPGQGPSTAGHLGLENKVNSEARNNANLV